MARDAAGDGRHRRLIRAYPTGAAEDGATGGCRRVMGREYGRRRSSWRERVSNEWAATGTEGLLFLLIKLLVGLWMAI